MQAVLRNSAGKGGAVGAGVWGETQREAVEGGRCFLVGGDCRSWSWMPENAGKGGAGRGGSKKKPLGMDVKKRGSRNAREAWEG